VLDDATLGRVFGVRGAPPRGRFPLRFELEPPAD
jgi:hypothetical protein